MIEIKKPSAASNNSPQLQTIYKDLVSDAVNFTQLNTSPYLISTGLGSDKIIIPISLVIDYYSIGTTNLGSFAISSGSAIVNNIGSSMFCFFGNLVQADQSGIITTPNYFQSSNCGLNQILDDNIYLWSQYNEVNADFTRFRIYFNYFLIDYFA